MKTKSAFKQAHKKIRNAQGILTAQEIIEWNDHCRKCDETACIYFAKRMVEKYGLRISLNTKAFLALEKMKSIEKHLSRHEIAQWNLTVLLGQKPAQIHYAKLKVEKYGNSNEI